MDKKYQLIRHRDSCEAALNELAASEVLGIDTETTGLDCYKARLITVQLATPNMTYIFAWQNDNFGPILRPVLENPATLKILHNAKFDYKFLRVHADIKLTNIFDTMLTERVLTTGQTRQNSLKAVVKKYFQVDMDKRIRTTFGQGPITAQQLEYAALDAAILLPLRERQLQAINSLAKVIALENELVPVLAEMELRGMLIDTPKWQGIVAGHQKKCAAARERVMHHVKPTLSQMGMFGVVSINVDSNTQLKDFLHRLGLKVPDTSKSTLKACDHPVAAEILAYRQHNKILSSFGQNVIGFIKPSTGRLHPDFRQIGADTGRFSCSKPNMQNLPVYFRYCIKAPAGYKIITSDYSQIELRILAEYSADPAFMRAFREKQDIHGFTASQMFGVPIAACHSDSSYRRQAKSINFGLIYGESAFTLAQQINKSVPEAKRLMAVYFRQYPGIKKWLDKTRRFAQTHGYTITMLGRRRSYNLPNEARTDYRRRLASIGRAGQNHPVQGTSADMVKQALVYIYRDIQAQQLDAHIISTVHDEVIIEVREDQATRCKVLVEKAMVEAGQLFLHRVPVELKTAVENTWVK